MGGASAFFCNSAPLPYTANCPRRFVVMGFNYERGIGEMLENLGHRAEAILARLFRAESFLQWTYTPERSPRTVTGTSLNLFERFLCFDQIAPGKANVGTVHYAPNSRQDYEWGNPAPVLSCADDWLHFPQLPDPPTIVRWTRASGAMAICARITSGGWRTCRAPPASQTESSTTGGNTLLT
jgi:hypothetical protein